MQYKNKDVEQMFAKVNKGIYESKKWKAKEMTKRILIWVWSVTIFPLMILWMFIKEKK